MNSKEDIIQSLKTILEMLKDRKIDVSSAVSAAADGFRDIVNANSNRNIFEVVFDDIKILYFLLPKFRFAELVKAVDGDSEKGYKLLLLVVAEKKISDSDKVKISGLGLPIQIWNIKELQYNITKHVLVPKQELVDDEQEVKAIIDHYSLKTKYQMPHILKSDPMARYLGLKSGDIIKVTRASPTAGEYIFYRCCL